MNNTVVRTIYGVIFLLVMIAGMLLHPLAYCALALFAMEVMLWEFFRMSIGTDLPLQRILAMITAAVAFCAVMGTAWLGISPVWTGCALLLLLVTFASSYFGAAQREHFHKLAYICAGLLYIGIPIVLSPFAMFRNGVFDGRLLLSCFIVIWSTDVGGYCFGLLFGKNGKKLFPEVSPKKSWAGFWGGLAMALASAWIMKAAGLIDFPLLHCLVAAAIMSVFGVLGDLFESEWKRSFGVKDSGNIIPGHGGLMDRFDSALFAIPAGIIYLVFIGLI
ncbi:MAG: phosphatidate cytidylyltransferase [Bacteroidales bacterium]|nr:phosphatidate cytidylyltransferase [Bacteroidales bacterium]MBP5373661.1 phosphatidate cytidylyltransferase [Bacteroidales bacterium]